MAKKSKQKLINSVSDSFNIELYHKEVFVFVGSSSEFRDYCKKVHELDDNELGDALGQTILTSHPDGSVYLIVFINIETALDDNTYEVIAHEATHVAIDVLRHIGVQQFDDECVAYMVGYCAKHITKVVHKFLNTNNKK